MTIYRKTKISTYNEFKKLLKSTKKTKITLIDIEFKNNFEINYFKNIIDFKNIIELEFIDCSFKSFSIYHLCNQITINFDRCQFESTLTFYYCKGIIINLIKSLKKNSVTPSLLINSLYIIDSSINELIIDYQGFENDLNIYNSNIGNTRICNSKLTCVNISNQSPKRSEVVFSFIEPEKFIKLNHIKFDMVTLLSLSINNCECQKIFFNKIFGLSEIDIKGLSVSYLDFSFFYKKIKKVILSNVKVFKCIKFNNIQIEHLEINMSDLNNDGLVTFTFLNSFVYKISQAINFWPIKIAGNIEDKIESYRLLKSIAIDEKNDFNESFYRFKEQEYRAKIRWHKYGIKNKFSAINSFIPLYINKIVSRNGDIIILPILLLLLLHLFLTFWLINLQNYDFDLNKFINIYFYTILPTHGLNWNDYAIPASLSFLMRFFSSLFIYHIIWCARKMNKKN